jgi:hypothetical protein
MSTVCTTIILLRLLALGLLSSGPYTQACRNAGVSQCRRVAMQACRNAGVSQCRRVAMQACRNAGVSQCRLYVACCMLLFAIPHTLLAHTLLTHTLQCTRIPSNTLVYTPTHSYTRTLPFQLKTARCGAMVHPLASMVHRLASMVHRLALTTSTGR